MESSWKGCFGYSHGVFNYDETDITMILHLLMAAESSTRVIHILSEDSEVFVLMIYWVYRNIIQHNADGKVAGGFRQREGARMWFDFSTAGSISHRQFGTSL